jgi:hypothetical protein
MRITRVPGLYEIKDESGLSPRSEVEFEAMPNERVCLVRVDKSKSRAALARKMKRPPSH